MSAGYVRWSVVLLQDRYPPSDRACVCCLALSITAEQRDQLEAIQRWAVQIIFGKEMDFDVLAIIHDIPLIADRRDRQMRQLFTGMHDSSHCLHRLLQENSVESAIHTLCNCKNYRVPFARTNRFKNSFLLYALRNFQWVLLNIFFNDILLNV